jgi:glycosyltransferase involved in cell wall biosynthesis
LSPGVFGGRKPRVQNPEPPHLARLLRAFARVLSEPPPLLVLPGYSTSFEAELEAEIRRLRIERRVRLLGWVADADLEGLYEAAACLVHPSLSEGFGLPVLEAMERAVPVACSTAPALLEVAGDAARYFDPTDEDGMREALEEILADPALSARLVAAGEERASMFSWQRAAARTLAVYERAGLHRGSLAPG